MPQSCYSLLSKYITNLCKLPPETWLWKYEQKVPEEGQRDLFLFYLPQSTLIS